MTFLASRAEPGKITPTNVSGHRSVGDLPVVYVCGVGGGHGGRGRSGPYGPFRTMHSDPVLSPMVACPPAEFVCVILCIYFL